MSHTCHARDCTTEIPPSLFMCKKHWFMLPASMRTLLWKEYEKGQEISKKPSTGYLLRAEECRYWVYQHEQELLREVAQETQLVNEINRLDGEL